MSPRTVTRSIETNAEPEAVLRILVDPRRIPEWAPAFADRVDADGPGRWNVTKDGAEFSLELAVFSSARTVDYLREIAPGRKSGAHIRVLPLPGGGSVIVMTIPVPRGRPAEEAEATLVQELESLVHLSAVVEP